jgi:hypothetical protein
VDAGLPWSSVPWAGSGEVSREPLAARPPADFAFVLETTGGSSSWGSGGGGGPGRLGAFVRLELAPAAVAGVGPWVAVVARAPWTLADVAAGAP